MHKNTSFSLISKNIGHIQKQKSILAYIDFKETFLYASFVTKSNSSEVILVDFLETDFNEIACFKLATDQYNVLILILILWSI